LVAIILVLMIGNSTAAGRVLLLLFGTLSTRRNNTY
jgi:hypothetical protein